MRFLFVLIILLTRYTADAQAEINGRVVQEGTGEAVAGASVFINNSSIGTVTATDGSFVLHNIPAGKYDLIVSAVGYETLVYALRPERTALKLRFEMHTKVTEMQNVVVGGYITETWAKWGKTFLETFLGVTPVAQKCTIKNTKTLRFRYYKKQQLLEVVADEPLQIDNVLLGYTLQYDLQDFKIDFRQHSSFFAGYTLFKDKRNAAKKAVEKRRRDNYFGSTMHFMRSLYTGKIADEGFQVRRMTRIYNLEKERVRALFKKEFQLGKDITVASGDQQQQDSSSYYKTLLQQKDYEDVYSPWLLTADSIITASGETARQIYWDHYLAVTYLNGTEAPEYLQYIREARKPIPPFSLLQLQSDQPVTIDASGNWSPPESLVTSGYWSWSDKVGNLLPLDYVP